MGEGEAVEAVVGVGVVEERVDNIVHYRKEHRMRDILADTDWGFFCSAVVVLQHRKKIQKRLESQEFAPNNLKRTREFCSTSTTYIMTSYDNRYYAIN